MGEMPIVGVAVHAGILAHRRDADAIGQRDIAEPKLAEQVRHERAFRALTLVSAIVLINSAAPQGVPLHAERRSIAKPARALGS
jgi:hypothetical protein